MNGFILFYRTHCGEWYIHSHKIYPTKADAIGKARKFLPPGTEIAVGQCINPERLAS